MTTETELARVEPASLAVQSSPEDAAQAFIRMLIERDTPMGEMTSLIETWKGLVADSRKTQFDRAMTKFQAECPPMPRGHASHLTRVNAAGVTEKSRYSDMADIAKTIAPHLRANGLSFEWEDTEIMEVGGQTYYRAHLRIRHESGYSERKSGPPIPIGKGNNNQSAQMQASAVVTTSQRLALRSAFGLYSIDQDEENAASAEPAATITEAQLDTINQLLGEYNELCGDGATKSLEDAMLKAFKVGTAAEIPADKCDYVCERISQRIAAAKAKGKQ